MKNNKMVVLLDTNVFLVSLSPFSKYAPIFDALIDGKFIMVITNEILSEYEEIIQKRYDKETVNDIFNLLSHLDNVQKQDIYFNWQLIEADKDDNKFVDCAISVGADYLVTDDKHFKILKSIPFPFVNVLNADGFLKILMN
jgi:putative PIN family toxin of toxin-antitoxin system